MYRTCAFCNGTLDGDGGPSGLGVGRRLAFDEWKGRLWVICPKCARWNLAPLDDRLERIDALARAARDGQVAAASEQVALIRWQGYGFVRVGKPARLEFAAWRYGERLRARRREQLRIVVPLGLAAMGLAVAVNVATGGSVGVFLWNLPSIVRTVYIGMVGQRKLALVEPPVCERCGSVMLLRAKHLERARLTATAHAGLALLLTCPRCGVEGTLLTGADADAALRRGLTYLNLARRGGRQRAADAVRVVESAGGPEELIRDVARRELTLRSLAPERRLALEIAVDERAEVAELERQWHDAEELAEIVDGMLSSDAELDARLRRLKGQNPPPPGQPSS
ncbi:MAG TPA: hypothetical protein VH116_11735 [Gemmatimonadales bacterium]|jgi:ribosomal protein S27AE|nr:hypothetical protein [Gemmatimonadales bacterium]